MTNFVTRLSPKQAVILLGLGSGVLLAMAYVFQYGFGFWPCTMCYWQRWPHWLMLGLGILALLPVPAPHKILLMLAAAVLLASAGLGFWHSGVEIGLLPGPTACSGGLALDGDPAAVLDRLLATPAPRCDEVTWSFLGMSMANWNGLISLAMAGLAVMVLVKSPRNRAGQHGA